MKKKHEVVFGHPTSRVQHIWVQTDREKRITTCNYVDCCVIIITIIVHDSGNSYIAARTTKTRCCRQEIVERKENNDVRGEWDEQERKSSNK